jgi:iron complex outermembrane recepter protein
MCSAMSASYCQSSGKISGRVMNDNKPFHDATATLLSLKDSAVIKVSLTNKDGFFEFDKLNPGRYIVLVSATGFKKLRSGQLEINGASDMQAGELNLIPLQKTMSGVTVTASRPLIEHKIDRTIVNVDASITNIGATALEILEKSPGVSVDKDGNISLKGKEGVMISIDGKPSQLSGPDLANFLRSMNSSQIDQVEIMTNPPARYDAAGNAGVINIRTRKNRSMGYNATISAGYMQGRYPKGNEGLNFNYREGKINFFGNIGHNYRKTFETLTIQRNIKNDNSLQLENYFDQDGHKIVKGHSLSIKMGLDYSITKNSTVGIVLNSMSGPNTVRNRNRTEIFNPSKELQSVTFANVINDSKWQNFSGNMNFRTLIKKKNEVSADIDYMNYKLDIKQFMENAIFDASGSPVRNADSLTGTLPQYIEVYSGRMDYLHPINKSSRFEAGAKLSIVKTDNDANYDSIQNGVLVHDYNRSNHFVYNENIAAAYINLNTSLTKKLSGQFGLRLENTHSNGKQLTTGSNFTRNYTSLFPTVFFQYKAGENNIYGFNYGRRIRRPDYGSLNPFIKFIDRYTYNKGNPDLKPQYSNSVELSHSFKNYLVTTINYSVTDDIIQNVIEQKGQEAYQTSQNIASMKQYGLSVSFNKQMNKWWNNSLNVNLFNNNFKGMVNFAEVDFKATNLTISGTQQFKLKKTLTAELNGKYRSSTLMGVLMTRPVGAISIGLSQQVMKTKGTFRISLRDVFYSQKMKASIKYGNVDATFQEVNDSRVIALNFSYRFSKGKGNAQKKRSSGSANEESERIGIDQ